MTDLQPIHVRAEVKDGEQVLGVVNIPLEYKGTVLKKTSFSLVRILVEHGYRREGRSFLSSFVQ